MVDLADEVSVSWVLGYIVDQHILKKDKKAQQNAEDSDDKSGNSGTGVPMPAMGILIPLFKVAYSINKSS